MEVYKFKCRNCGSKEYVKVDDKTYKCPYCGYKEEVFSNNKKEPDYSSKEYENDNSNGNIFSGEKFLASNSLIMLLICLFGGMIGIHKFVEKKFVMGFVYLFTGAFFGIGYVLDLVNYLKRFLYAKKEESNGKN